MSARQVGDAMKILTAVFGVVMLLLGAALFGGGAWLAVLGGSWYYVIPGGFHLAFGALTPGRRRRGGQHRHPHRFHCRWRSLAGVYL